MLADAETFEAAQKRRQEVLVFLSGRLTPELYAKVERQLRACYLIKHATDGERHRTFHGY
ncbi:MAG: hypothetical protein Q7S29_04095 [Candidatus Peribacter sp.]|nr:hypothetical protein [Candidatus Peribacter sp.]